MTLTQVVRGQETVAGRKREYGVQVRSRLLPCFERASIRYPPAQLALLALKDEKRLEVWASSDGKAFRHVLDYPILGLSGTLGPKLYEGDMQVPEGIYGIESLNPNSRFHLALRLDYPNAFDRRHAKSEGRRFPGSNIMIHGGKYSTGCIAVGDVAIEDVFVLVAETGVDNVTVVISPIDLRNRHIAPALHADMPVWVPDLYRNIGERLDRMKRITTPFDPRKEDPQQEPTAKSVPIK